MTDSVESPTNATERSPRDRLLRAIENLSKFHREHEKFYSGNPREQSVVFDAPSRPLLALADRWSPTPPSTTTPFSPFEGAEDLNDSVALQLDGVLFMEGED